MSGLSYDHRIVDGADAARVKNTLEHGFPAADLT